MNNTETIVPTPPLETPAPPLDDVNLGITAANAAGEYAMSTHRFEAAIAQYTEPQQEIVRWWFFLAQERGWSLAKLAATTGVHASTISRIFRGIYAAGIEKSCEVLIKAKENFAEVSDNPEFIQTALASRMFASFDKCRALGCVTIMWGPMGIGKTTILEEYKRRNNHGKTHTVRFPAGATFAFFVSHLAKSLGITITSNSQFILRERILQVMGAGKRLLIIDELHQAFLTTRADTSVRCCEFLREIADVSKCGIVLIGTEVLQREIFSGPHKEALKQLVDRGTVQLALPAKATKQDILHFLAFYGLKFPTADESEARDILADIIVSSGLRKLTLHLRDGASYAARKGERYEWTHFTAAFDAIRALAR